MTRADWQAATPKCTGRPIHSGSSLCGRPLEWTTEPTADAWSALLHPGADGLWCCPRHGPMLSGMEAAQRAGWAAADLEPQAA